MILSNKPKVLIFHPYIFKLCKAKKKDVSGRINMGIEINTPNKVPVPVKAVMLPNIIPKVIMPRIKIK